MKKTNNILIDYNIYMDLLLFYMRYADDTTEQYKNIIDYATSIADKRKKRQDYYNSNIVNKC